VSYSTDEKDGEIGSSIRLKKIRSSIALPSKVQKGGGPNFSEILRRRADIHHQPTHKQLKQDLIEHIWQKFANRRNN